MLIRLAAVLILATTLLMLVGATARAAPLCMPKDEAFKMAKEKFGETPAIIGLTADTPESMMMMMVLVNPTNGSWTIGLVNPEGVFCLLTTGSDIQSILKDLKVRPEM